MSGFILFFLSKLTVQLVINMSSYIPDWLSGVLEFLGKRLSLTHGGVVGCEKLN